MYLRLVSFLFLLLSSISCSNDVDQKLHKKPTLTPKLLVTEQSNIIPLFDSLKTDDKQKIIAIYTKNKYKSIFYTSSGKLTQNGEKIKGLLQKSIYYGVPQMRVLPMVYENKDSLKPEVNQLVLDAQLTIGILRLINDVANGFSDSLKLQNRPLYLSSELIIDTLKNIREVTQIDSLIQRYAPANENYKMLSTALKQHVDTLDFSIQLLKVPLTKKDSINSYQKALENLKRKDFIFDTMNEPQRVIRKYQKWIRVSASGLIDEPTKQSLEESPLEVAYRIAWNMEKTRYEPVYPKHYIKVNIPEFKLFYFNEDTIASINNVVVGKVEHSSPTLKARIYGIQTFPNWNVPHKIAVKEILPAIKADVKYLEKNQMVLLRGGKEIDPHSINWKKINEKNFYFQVRQLPGEKNSLGIIKFEFYNKYDVYIHDTPQKRLLDYPNRMYSHGCIRCQNPVELGKKVLEIDENKVVPDSLDSMLYRQEQFLIKLKKQIPIYIEYNSIAVTPVLVEKKHKRKNESDEYKNEIIYCRDVYFKDKEAISYFFGTKIWAE